MSLDPDGADWRPTPPSRACSGCGVTFPPRDPDDGYCSPECEEAALREPLDTEVPGG